MRAPRRRVEVVQLLGIVGAVVAWLGWFEIAPALGFPTIGPAAMLNRVFVPKSDPGVWLGWVVLVLGVVAAAALYSLAAARGRLRPGPVSGLFFGLAAWAIAGMVVMTIIGHISPPALAPPPPPGPPLPTTPDPMHATFMMLHLGALAPVDALVAWLLLGAVVGAASIPTKRESEARADGRGRVHSVIAPTTGLLVLAAALTLGGWISVSHATGAVSPASAGTQTRVLATGEANALPEGAVFASVIDLPQATGATLGPHAHVPGFAYVLEGQETISFGGGPTMELNSGQGGFMGGLVIHSHENRSDRAPAALFAASLVALGLILSGVSLMKIAKRAAIAALTGLLIVAGVVALLNPWANDWLFIGVRPEAARGGVMPLPNATRVYESPNLESLSPGPYTETLRLITVPVGGLATVQREPGPEMFLVLSGQAEVRLNGGSPISLGTSQAALAQHGASVQISNPGGEALDLLSFSLVASGGNQ